MTAQNQVEWPIEQLMEWAKLATKYPELVEIARTALSNTEAKDRAVEFTKEQGLDEAVAKSCRWLKILRDRSVKEGREEEFEKYLIGNQEKPKQEEKKMEKTKTAETETIRTYAVGLDGLGITVEHNIHGNQIRIWFATPEQMIGNAIQFLNQLSPTILNASLPHMHEKLRDEMIQFLEEKFGLKVKICWHCKYSERREVTGLAGVYKIDYCTRLEPQITKSIYYHKSCEYWAPKEVSQKIEAGKR